MSAAHEIRFERFHDPRLNPQENKAVELLRNGFSREEIQDEMDIGPTHLSTLFSRARVKGVDVPMGHGGPRSAWSNRDLLRMRMQGLSPTDIAARTGLSAKSINVRLSVERKRRDLPMQVQGPTAHMAPKWAEMKARGLSFAEIARRAGVSRDSVAGAVWRHRRKLRKQQQGASR